MAGPGRSKTGGRPKGGLNKRTIALRMGVVIPPEALTVTEKLSQLQPLSFMLAVMADENNPLGTRLDAAAKAAPYVHHRKGQIDQTGRDVPITVNVLRFSGDEPAEPLTIEHEHIERG